MLHPPTNGLKHDHKNRAEPQEQCPPREGNEMKTVLMTMTMALLAVPFAWANGTSGTETTAGNSFAVAQASAPSPSSDSRRFSGTVELYITEWCGYCKRAVAYMKARNIPHVVYDIEKDEAARKRFLQLGGSGVPLIMVGNRRMSGFSPELLEQYLGNR